MSTVDLRIGGMTCATCASRIERKLNRLDGVAASVNYATETARVRYAAPVTLHDLVRTVEATGYTARMGIFEMMDVNDEIRRLIMNNSDASVLTQASRRNGIGGDAQGV